MENFVEITVEKGGSHGNKKVICIDGEDFGSNIHNMKNLAQIIAEQFSSAFEEHRIGPSKTKPTISQEEWEYLQKFVEDALEGTLEEKYANNTAYSHRTEPSLQF